MIDIQNTLGTVNTGEDIINVLLANPIDRHPFFQSAKKNNIGYVSVILENGRELDITGFLARLISMTTNVNLRAKLVLQLYDELGSGNPEKIHIKLIGYYLNEIKPHSKVAAENQTELDAAYDRLNQVYRRLFHPTDFHEGLGVAIANEIIVQPIFEYFKGVTANSGLNLSHNAMIWLNAHDELEEDHVADSLEMANMIEAGSEDLAKAASKAFELFNEFWVFFNTVDRIKLA
jgi:pyrroloquinoline quinone (PQQ) biosynthesis protein C